MAIPTNDAPTDAVEVGYCWQCGYDLRGLADSRCPECGFRFDLEAVRNLNEEWCALRLRGLRDATLLQGVACGVALVSILTQGWPVLSTLMRLFLAICLLIWSGMDRLQSPARDSTIARTSRSVMVLLAVVLLISLLVGKGFMIFRLLLLLAGLLLGGIELQRFLDGSRRGKLHGVTESLVESVRFSDRVNRAMVALSTVATVMVMAMGL